VSLNKYIVWIVKLWYYDTYNKEVHTEIDLFSLSMVTAVLNAM